jgi:hypothetical protein
VLDGITDYRRSKTRHKGAELASITAARRKKQTYTRGWSEKRVREVIAYYNKETEEEELAEYEAGMQIEGLRVMLVPAELVA